MKFDVGRRADLARIAEVLGDPATKPRVREAAKRARAKILRQAKSPEIGKLRNRMLKARSSGDQMAADKAVENLVRVNHEEG